MDNIKIHYKTEKADYFVHYDIYAQLFIELNFESKTVRWYYYLPLPEGMHWKAGDQLGGLGFNHHTKTQSFEEFIENPHHEIPKEEYNKALIYIQRNSNLD